MASDVVFSDSFKKKYLINDSNGMGTRQKRITEFEGFVKPYCWVSGMACPGFLRKR